MKQKTAITDHILALLVPFFYRLRAITKFDAFSIYSFEILVEKGLCGPVFHCFLWDQKMYMTAATQRGEQSYFHLWLMKPYPRWFQNQLFSFIHTCCDSSSDWLTSTLVSERHQVNSILFPWSQTSLHKGSDGAGQLCSHPSIIVLGKKHRQ